MIRVEEAEKIILQEGRDFGAEQVSFDDCLGRVLAEELIADRDLPPFNRVTMDGIAIIYRAFKNGTRLFKIKATQPAGENPIEITSDEECIEIMTGAALPATTDTIIPYEEIKIDEGLAAIKTETLTKSQFIHPKGKDKKQHETLAEAGQFISPAIIAVAATVGKTSLLVKKRPAVVIISTGDELTDIDETPAWFQIRRSNNHVLQAVLKQYGMEADMLHLADNPDILEEQLGRSIAQYDIIIMSGGVSMGKYDFVPAALEKLQVKKLFHKVQQRPGKPFWFGKHAGGSLVFAFPGNPVSAFMCVHRYFLPWLKKSWQLKAASSYAILDADFTFKPALQYFLQVKLTNNEKGEWLGTPVEGNGSGDFINLLGTDAFMELPLERTDFKKG
ncbi:MAG TPA: molybdopterin molybdotransferase MoeA, partial [Puia sp.]|nr:molybdopterin molybdotransferase MoeA [Puia sp.]